MADASDARKLEVDWQRRAELAAAQTAAAVAEARAFQQETVAARAQAAATVRVGSPTDPRTPRRTSGVRTTHNATQNPLVCCLADGWYPSTLIVRTKREQEAGGERVFALQRDVAALEGDNRGLRNRCMEAEGRLQVCLPPRCPLQHPVQPTRPAES